MSDTRTSILKIIQKPQLSSLATVTADGKPWVRYVMTTAEDDMTLRCATFVNARKVSQIQENPEVHVTCGVNNLTDESVSYVQVQARAALTTEKDARHAFWNPGLAKIFKGPDDPRYGVIVMTPYRIELCSPGSHEPEVLEL